MFSITLVRLIEYVLLSSQVSPVQYPTRYVINLHDEDDKMLLPNLLHKNGQLPYGGADFPMINYLNVQ